MMHLQIQLLGAFQASLDGRPITGFESNKVRALLAYLAVEADQPHSRDELIGLLWPDQPDAAARANLRQALANLRHTLSECGVEPRFLAVTSEGIHFSLPATIGSASPYLPCSSPNARRAPSVCSKRFLINPAIQVREYYKPTARVLMESVDLGGVHNLLVAR